MSNVIKLQLIPYINTLDMTFYKGPWRRNTAPRLLG